MVVVRSRVKSQIQTRVQTQVRTQVPTQRDRDQSATEMQYVALIVVVIRTDQSVHSCVSSSVCVSLINMYLCIIFVFIMNCFSYGLFCFLLTSNSVMPVD